MSDNALKNPHRPGPPISHVQVTVRNTGDTRLLLQNNTVTFSLAPGHESVLVIHGTYTVHAERPSPLDSIQIAEIDVDVAYTPHHVLFEIRNTAFIGGAGFDTKVTSLGFPPIVRHPTAEETGRG